MTFTQRLQCFPPILCRLLARQDGHAMTTQQIVDKSSGRPCNDTSHPGNRIAVAVYERISGMTDWLEVPTMEGIYFQRGCGIPFDDAKAMKRLDDYLAKRPTFIHLRRSADFAGYYRPLMALWRSCYPEAVTEAYMPHKHLRAVLNRLSPLLQHEAR